MADDETTKSDKKLEKLRTPKGVHDILPDEQEYYTFIKKVVRHRARQSGFRRITTPVCEFTDVFKRSIGEATDVVQKEMYTFEDRKGRSLTLKPEGTAGVVRSYIQHGMNMLSLPVELYYIEPHFRYERPQKGRYRQFWQFGFEVIGESDPAIDAQVIMLAYKIFKDIGLADILSLQINNIGSMESRADYADALKNYYMGKERSLCFDCQERLHANTLRLLDCKEEDCQILAELAPKFEDHRSKEDKEHYGQLKEFLDELGISYTENSKLVRGLDYYTQTVFEFWHKDTGAQNAVGGGGRYDGLVELMGGEDTPAVGFAAGIERIISNMKEYNIKVPTKDELHVFVAQLGQEAKKKCLPLLEDMHEAGIKAFGAVGKGSIKAQLGRADKLKVPYTVIIGITEVRDGTAIIRDMEKGVQKIVKSEELIEELVKAIGEDDLDKYSPGEVIY